MDKVFVTDECWIWTAFISPTGYAYFGKYRAARWYWEHLHGPLPKHLVLDHLCRNRYCVNPAHLEPVTHRENILRGEGLAAQNARKTHCRHGHELTPENIYRPTKGGRVCRKCKSRREVQRVRRRRWEREVRTRITTPITRAAGSRAWAQTISAFQHTIRVDEPVEDVFLRLQPFQRKIFQDVCGSFAYPDDGSDVPF